MNDDRRKELRKALAFITDARVIVENAAEAEREYYDNMPEGLQAGEKGTKADEDASALDELKDALEAGESTLHDMVGEG